MQTKSNLLPDSLPNQFAYTTTNCACKGLHGQFNCTSREVISLMLFLLPKTASWEEKNSSSKEESRDELCWGKIFITMMNASNIYYFRQYSVNCYLTQLAFRIFVCAACGVRPSWKTTNTFPLNLFQRGKLGDKCDASLSPSFSFVVFHAASHKLSSWTREFCD